MELFTCPQTGERVYRQSANGHARIGFMFAKGTVQLRDNLKAAHWSEAEREDISRLIVAHESTVIAHANAIEAGAF